MPYNSKSNSKSKSVVVGSMHDDGNYDCFFRDSIT
jgi:hypothetical protein